MKKPQLIGAAIVAAVLVIVVAVVAFRCSTGPANYTESDSDKTIKTKAGKQFIITLRGNATTGYIWQMAKGTDTSVVKKVSDKYTAENTGMVGSGGDHAWTFEAVSAGSTTITLQYLRPWEKPASPANVLKYKVDVE